MHRGRHGAAGEVDYCRAGPGRDLDRGSADAVGGLAAAAGDAHRHAPFGSVFAAARAGAPWLAVVEEEAHRIALHIVPLAAVADVGWSCSAAA